MCNLYSITKGPQAIRDIARAMRGDVGNMPALPGVFPDYSAPIGRNTAGGRELTVARWGMPSPAFALKGRNSDPGVTNVRNTSSPHWRRHYNTKRPHSSLGYRTPAPKTIAMPSWPSGSATLRLQASLASGGVMN